MTQSARRMSALALCLAVVLASGASPLSSSAGTTDLPATAPSSALETVVSGLDQPLFVGHAGDDSGRMFIVERGGRIRILRGSALESTPFLDIDSKVGSSDSEQGLLGLAFHPTYSSNGLFYVDYTNNSGDTVVSRFQVSADPGQADPESETVLLTIDQPAPNHNGGMLAFGPDGYLYIGTGDGGGAGDPSNNAQNITTLLGKILRIDVDSGSPYAIPAGNPYADNPDSSIKKEIWAFGLRNPWRFSFDRGTGDLYIGDVGQGSREEIDYQPASSTGGENYGWRVMEGSQCYNAPTCDSSGKTMPVAEYGHGGSGGCSVTGGYVYRGRRSPVLRGTYLYGDYCTGRIWGLVNDPLGDWTSTLLIDASFNISSFGEDQDGEVYLTDFSGGRLMHIVVPQVPVDFNGDGTSDVAVFRGGAWLFHDLNSASFTSGVWTGGPPPCIPAPMDFDADGIDDFSQFCSGAWLLFNDDGSLAKGIWTGGVPGDLPVPADFDGDGTDDVVVFRGGAWLFFDFDTGDFLPARSVWTGAPPSWTGGSPVPVPMDYDGDGTADFTVFSQGPWHFFNDDGSYNKGIWTGGVVGDIPTPGDFDGDGTDDVVVFRGGAWLFFDFDIGDFLPARSVWTGAPPHWTGGTSLPAPLDFDGDGALDFTVWSGGPWHFFNNNGSFNKGIWTGGISGDLPLSRRLLP